MTTQQNFPQTRFTCYFQGGYRILNKVQNIIQPKPFLTFTGTDLINVASYYFLF